jgi:hypothetical protein
MVETASPAPDELVDEPQSSPPADPAPEATPEDRADRQTAGAQPPNLLAEYTRSRQEISQYREALGIPKTATAAEVLSAIEAFKARPEPVAPETDDEEIDDPRVEAAMKRAREAEERALVTELRVIENTYGAVATDAYEIINIVRASNDIEDLVGRFAAYAAKHGPSLTGGEVAVAGEDEEEPDEETGAIGLSEGDRAPTAPSSAARGGRGESGVVGAIRAAFKSAGAG